MRFLFLQSHRILAGIALIVVLFVQILSSHDAAAAANYQINYQGKLTNASNVAVADGTYNMRFWLLTSPTVGTSSAIWSESLTGSDKVQVTNGLFSVMLGSTTPLNSVDFNQTLYLGVEIGGTGAVAWDGEMSPRKVLGAVPAAFYADQASSSRLFGGIATTSFLRSDEADTASGLLTFTNGIIANSSSTITNLTALIATTTTLVINGESFTDLTGNGLSNVAGLLTCATANASTFGCLTSADWTVFNNKVSSTSIDTSSELASLLTDETGTGNAVFSASPTLSGLLTFSYASGTALTTSGNAYFGGNVGIGTTSPQDKLDVYGNVRAGGNFRTTVWGSYYGADAETRMSVNDTYLQFFAGNGATEKMRINSSGSVGIGTTSPAYKLDILGTDASSGSLRLMTSSSNNGLLISSTNANASTRNYALLANSVTFGDLAIRQSTALGSDPVSGNVRFYIDPSGNVGIGTTSPLGKLDVYGGDLYVSTSNSNYYLQVDVNANASDSLNLVGPGGNTFLQFDNITGLPLTLGAESEMTIKGGNVGIGTTSPGVRLQVATGNAGYTWTPNSRTGLIVEGSNVSGSAISIVSKSSGTSNLWFGDEDSESIGQLRYDHTNNTLYTYVGGNDRMAINSVGVGIGTSSPSARLAISNSVSTTANTPLFTIASTTGGTSTTTLMTVLASGNVGIGTAVPTADLVIASSFSPTVRISNGNNGTVSFASNDNVRITGSTSEYLQFFTNGIERMRFTSTGNVGVGSTTPSRMLTVNGDIFGAGLTATGTVTFTGMTGGVLTTNGSGVVSASTTIGNAYLDSSVILSTEIDTSSELAGILADETGTGNAVFSASPTLTGLLTFANASGTALTTSGNAYFGGNVGIGTTSPFANFSIGGSGNLALFGDSTAAHTYLGFAGANGYSNGRAYVGYNITTGNTVLQGASSKGIEFNVNNSTFGAGTAVVITTTGNVGIGTTTPAKNLTILAPSSATSTLRLDTTDYNNDSRIEFSEGGNFVHGAFLQFLGINKFQIGTRLSNDESIALTIEGNSNRGNVGIGSTTPSRTLTVNGDIIGAGLTATGTVTLSGMTGGILTTNGSGVVSASTTIGTAYMDSSVILSTEIDTSAELAGILGDETGTGNAVFSASPTLSGLLTFSYASGTALTTTGNAYLGGLALATTTRNSTYVLDMPTDFSFVRVGSAAASDVRYTMFTSAGGWEMVTQNTGHFTIAESGIQNVLTLRKTTGYVGIGTSTPSQKLDVYGAAKIGSDQGTFFTLSGNSGYASLSVNSGGSINLDANSVYLGSALGNYLRASGSSGTNPLVLAAIGTGANLDIQITPKGTGNTVFTSGNVGIGSTTPSSKLTVADGSQSLTFGEEGGSTSVLTQNGSSFAEYRNKVGTLDMRIGGSATYGYFQTFSNHPMTFWTNGANERMRITEAGLIGIGTTSPTAKLTVEGGKILLDNSEAYQIRQSNRTPINVVTMSSANELQLIAGTSGSVSLYPDGGNDGAGLTVVNGGNVGVGSTSPNALLTIANKVGTAANTPLFTVASTTAGTATTTLMTIFASGATYISNLGVGIVPTVASLEVAATNVGTARVGYNNGGASGTSYAFYGQASNIAGTSYGIYGDTGSNPDASSIALGANVGNTNGVGLFVNSTAVTTGTLAGIQQSSSAFTGDALAMNMAATSGSFSGNFINATYNSSPRFTVKSSGAVGISSSTPTAFLTVSNTVDTAANTPLFTIASTTGGTATSTIFRVSADGNVGIGTSTPAYALDVVGSANVDIYSAYKQGGNTVLYASSTKESIAVGQSANAAGSGSWITAVGYQSLFANSGNFNTAIGHKTLFGNTTGGGNTALGFQALLSNTTGGSNTAMGVSSLRFATSATNTVAIGWWAGAGTGSYQNQGGTYVGYQAGLGVGTGSNYNTLIGYQAGYDITTGTNNTILGQFTATGAGITTGSGNILIGNGVRSGLSQTGSNQLNIGNLIFGSGLASDATLSSGYVGIGTSSPTSRLTLDTASFTGSGVAGLKESYSFINSEENAVYYGNEMFITNTPTATSTLVGKMIRVADNSDLANTVRGLEVQAHRGTNTKGENTAISGFGKTFGVRGTTFGSAGDTFLPAGIYAESQGTSQGNALRAYSGTLTTEDLVLLYQDTSTFTGTGLEMDFGNSGGSFTGSSARFMDLKVNGTSQFAIMSDGKVGIGTSTPTDVLTVIAGSGSIRFQGDYSAVRHFDSSGTIRFLTGLRADVAGSSNYTFYSYGGDWSFSNGNVGIGTSTPTSILHLTKSGIGTNAIKVQDTSGAGIRGGAFGGSWGGNGVYVDSLGADGWVYLGTGSGDADQIAAYTNGSERLRIDSSGNVGIGTTTPNTKLTVEGGVASSQLNFKSSGYTGGGYLISTSNSQAIIAGGTEWNGSAWEARSTAASFVNLSSGNINFSSNTGLTPGATFTPTQVMTILTTGNVGIGSLAPVAKLHVASTTADGITLLRLEDSNSTCDFNANAGGPTCGSDRTLKTDIEEMRSELSIVSGLRAVNYRWKTDDSDAPLQSGFIAQEVQELIPELVRTGIWVDGTERLFLNTSGMMPYVVGAMGEMTMTLEEILSTGTSTMSATSPFYQLFDGEEDTVWEKLVRIAQGFVDGVLTIAGLRTEELCVGSVCVDEATFLRMVESAGAQPASTGTSGGATPEPTTTDTTSTTTTESVTSTSTPSGGVEAPPGDTAATETPQQTEPAPTIEEPLATETPPEEPPTEAPQEPVTQAEVGTEAAPTT